MKSLIETMYGLESSGGGGGGGLLSGIADNVMGEAGGSMMDGLFGGGLGGGASASTMEGDIKLGIDGRLNYLWVTGATANDLGLIDAAVEMFDISTPPQNPETAGQVYVIQVQHRDPEEMKTSVETLMEVYFKDAEAGGGGGGGNDQANMMKMMRQLAGGGGGGGGEAKEVKPRGFLIVDTKTSQLIFMGPKAIFVQVEALVLFLDQPEVEEPRVMKQFDMKGADGARMARMLQNLLGTDKVDVVGADEAGSESTDGEGGENKAAGATPSKAADDAQAKQAEAARNNFIQMMRARGGAGGGGQRGGGGGQRGGGGGR